MEDDEEEQINTSTQPRQRQQAASGISRDRGNEYHYDSQIDPDRAATARQIFEDPQVLRDRVLNAQKQREELQKTDQKATLEEFFDGDEIDDQFATKQDKMIAAKDIPERLQIKLAE